MSGKPAAFKNHPFPFPESRDFPAIVHRVIDGDTLEVEVEEGFYDYAYVQLRLKDINCPEIFGKNAPAHAPHGQACKAFVEAEVLGKQVEVTTYRDRTSFGRFEATLRYIRGEEGVRELVDVIRAAGYDWTDR